ncbi:PAS domain-containing protein [Mycobacterium sp. 852002-40037_SCH5390672]|uniref:PAS domain-containing protein n=1 Tax=Mycobacterium sp. 852002-40037_SCH5390672 TaxID=1834089 RepID=UPI000804FDE8|nr:PAS domain-containing protein [Mycobacterium sp. 852002-40037_SCH5390672]OBB98553.1 hypothetical protein A5782_24480 [Mycobacterium sp. 852002-40037_SCH5390672]
MGNNWLLLEVLGNQPVVVAQGTVLRKFIPLSAFLRRNGNFNAINAVVGETIRSGRSVVDTIADRKTDRKTVIQTEVIAMNDGRVHGVHLWAGSPLATPPDRPLPGAIVWNLTTATASDTPQALLNSGLDLHIEKTDGRPFAADMPVGDINDDESAALVRSMTCKPGDIFCSTWDATSYDEQRIRVSFVARAALEPQRDGTSHLVCRAMNWRVPHRPAAIPRDDLAMQILKGTSQEGLHRAIFDLESWNLLKWIDAPFPQFDWRGDATGRSYIHPDDRPVLCGMIQRFTKGPASGLLRLRAGPGAWTLVHATVYRVHLLHDHYVGLISLRLPTAAEVSCNNE